MKTHYVQFFKGFFWEEFFRGLCLGLCVCLTLAGPGRVQAVSSGAATALPLSTCENLLLYVLDKSVAYSWWLRRAAARGNEAKVDWLLMQDETRVNASDRLKFTALHLAAANGHLSIVQKLIMAGADIRLKTWPDAYTVLHSAAEGGQVDVIRYLLVERRAPWEADEMGDTPIHVAVHAGHRSALQVFAETGEHLNDRDKKGLTPLHWAVHRGDKQMVQSLITHGAQVNAVAYSLAEAQQEEKENGHKTWSELVNEPGIDEAHASAYTPLHIAAQKGFTGVAQQLLDAGADVHARTEGGGTILHIAATAGQLNMVQWALSQGVSAQTRNAVGRTALDEAYTERYYDIMDVLKK